MAATIVESRASIGAPLVAAKAPKPTGSFADRASNTPPVPLGTVIGRRFGLQPRSWPFSLPVRGYRSHPTAESPALVTRSQVARDRTRGRRRHAIRPRLHFALLRHQR